MTFSFFFSPQITTFSFSFLIIITDSMQAHFKKCTKMYVVENKKYLVMTTEIISVNICRNMYTHIYTHSKAHICLLKCKHFIIFFFTQYIENIFPFQLTHPFFKLGYSILYMCVIVHLLNSLMGISVNFMNICFIFLVVTIKLLTHVFKVNKQPKKKNTQGLKLISGPFLDKKRNLKHFTI